MEAKSIRFESSAAGDHSGGEKGIFGWDGQPGPTESSLSHQLPCCTTTPDHPCRCCVASSDRITALEEALRRCSQELVELRQVNNRADTCVQPQTLVNNLDKVVVQQETQEHETKFLEELKVTEKQAEIAHLKVRAEIETRKKEEEESIRERTALENETFRVYESISSQDQHIKREIENLKTEYTKRTEQLWMCCPNLRNQVQVVTAEPKQQVSYPQPDSVMMTRIITIIMALRSLRLREYRKPFSKIEPKQYQYRRSSFWAMQTTLDWSLRSQQTRLFDLVKQILHLHVGHAEQIIQLQ